MADNLEGNIQIQAKIVPTNDNPRMPVTDVKYVKGAPQVFVDIGDLALFHPNKMLNGMSCTVMNWPQIGTITDFRLNSEPDFLKDASNNSIITVDNFQQFWVIQAQTIAPKSRVYQYAADGPGGGTPIFPYTVGTESAWVNTYDASKGHKWLRFRDDDVDLDTNGIFDNWSIPIAIAAQFQSGDYIENRFRRQAVSSTTHTGLGTMTVGKYYVVETGSITIIGDLEANDIGEYGTSTIATVNVGRTFKYVAGNTYTFNTATALETLRAPSRTVDGLPNNEPIGWDDVIPGGTDQLWQISAQKSVYGQLKTEWILKKIVENPNYIRYSDAPSPHPDTIAGPNTSANSGSSEDTALEAAGWKKVYNNQSFIATRQDDPGINLYTNWLVEKINEESGEYTDRVFKLFDLNLDTDSPVLLPPSNRDASKDGWSDTPVEETATQINYVSEARKFFNGELKTPWSQPVPYTGKDTFSDTIDSDLGDNFKYTNQGVVSPAQITLQANLYKGLISMWEDASVNISYAWKKVYDGGSIVNVTPSSNPADPFYTLAAAGVSGTPGYLHNLQRLVVKPGAVSGLAVFRCVQTVSLPDGDDIIFEEEYSILDVTDGKDAKSITISADNDRVIYDSVGTVFVPATIIMRAYWSNIPSPAIKFYRWNGASWTLLANGVGGYSIVGNILSTAATNVFASTGTAQEQRYAVSTHASNPDSADFITTFSDYVTIAKLGAAGVGSPGVNAISGLLSNEAHTVIVDSTTNLPIAGEITAAGKAVTLLEVYDGTTKKIYLTDYTVAVGTDNADIVFNRQASGNDCLIYIQSWASLARRAVCTVTVTYGSRTVVKKFSISSTVDAPGAIILDIDSDKGFVFTPADKTNKTLSAKLYDTSKPPATQLITLPDVSYTFKWTVANVAGTNNSANYNRVVTRANILVTSNVTLEVYKDGVLYRSRTITVTDVNDGKSYRAFTDAGAVNPATQALTNQDGSALAAPTTVSGVSWYSSTHAYWQTHSPVFAQDAEYNGSVWSWSAPYRIKGEIGSQGESGNFFYTMFKSEDPGPPALGAGGNASTLAQMIGASWTSRPAASGIIWKTERPWIGQGVSFNGNGDPSTGPVVGGAWTSPVRISAKDGLPGDDGIGTAGPGYNGITYQGTDGAGGNVYNFTPVNGAVAAQIVAPKGQAGTNGVFMGGFMRAYNYGVPLGNVSIANNNRIYVGSGDLSSNKFVDIGVNPKNETLNNVYDAGWVFVCPVKLKALSNRAHSHLINTIFRLRASSATAYFTVNVEYASDVNFAGPVIFKRYIYEIGSANVTLTFNLMFNIDINAGGATLYARIRIDLQSGVNWLIHNHCDYGVIQLPMFNGPE